MLVEQNQEVTIDPQVIAPALIGLPQVECNVVHHFAPGVYIREISIPAGTFIVGHNHKDHGINIALKGGGVLFVDGIHRVVESPEIIHSKPGAKMMYAITDVVWWNIFPNPDDERDIETLESRLTDKPEIDKLFHKELLKLQSNDRTIDVANYFGMEFEQELSDKIDAMPIERIEGSSKIAIRDSAIDGKGVFLTCSAIAGELIGAAFTKDCATTIGKHINHAKFPNCSVHLHDGSIYLMADKDLHGNQGGTPGDELTIDYRELNKLMEVRL